MAKEPKRRLIVDAQDRVKCEGCGDFTDIIRPVVLSQRTGGGDPAFPWFTTWTSHLCGRCLMDYRHGQVAVSKVGDPIDVKRYKGALEQSASRAASDIRPPPPPS